MKALVELSSSHAALGRLLDTLRSPLLLATRLFVGWQFWKAGYLKIMSWESTLSLFESEYRVPLLPPHLAAILGTFGELFFPLLLFFGLFGRIGALGTFLVNAMAVISYRHVLLVDGAEAALAQHVLWGFMLLVLIVFGTGRISMDAWLERLVVSRRGFDSRIFGRRL